MNKTILRLLSIVFVAALFTACQDDDYITGRIIYDQRADNRVYFIYMASDNSLYGNSIDNINDIMQSATLKNMGMGRVIVFYDRRGMPTQLLEFSAGTDGRGMKKILWEEPNAKDLNTASPEVFALALGLMKQYATAGGRRVDSYILDMWSHGDAWEQHTPPSSPMMMPRSVANDDDGPNGSFLELEDFVDEIGKFKASSGVRFDAVVFAQCYGASVEMLYLLRNETDMVIGSAPEMGAYGIPYNKVMASIFAPKFDYEGYCDAYYDFYKNDPYWDDAGGSIAVFDCAAFDDGFVNLMGGIFSSQEYADAISALTAISSATNGKSIGIQTYSYRSGQQYPYKYFDLGDFVDYIYHPNVSAANRVMFREYMDDIVLYKLTTGRVFSMSIDPAKFSGISTYIMLENVHYTSLNTNYMRTAWYNEVYP